MLPEDPRGIVFAADVEPSEVGSVLSKIHDVPGLIAVKTGMTLSGDMYGLKEMYRQLNDVADIAKIHDYQKAGNDIPEMGLIFANMLSRAGVNAAILFPFGGAATQRDWTKACQEAGMDVLVGGHMTQPEFLASEGGYIADDAPERIFKLAMEMGVREFVVPGNKVPYVEKYYQFFCKELGDGNFRLWAPGFVKQGGVISETAKAAGPKFAGIVGTAIYKAEDPRAATIEMTSQLRAA